MTEYFRITGLNLIPFDARVTGAADTRFTLTASPQGMDEFMTDDEVRAMLPKLPQKIRGHALKRGLSRITFPFTIKGSSDADMEDARHDLTETLEDGKLFIETQGARGTRAVLQVKANNAVQQSYKTIFYGEAIEMGGRTVLGAPIKQHFLLNLQMILYCEPYWRPETPTALWVNEIYCPSFEEDSDADGLADNWTLMPGAGHPTVAIETTIVLHGCDSQKVTTDAANEGIYSATMVAPAGITIAYAYAWICRPAAGSNIRVVIRDTSVGVNRATASFDTPGWTPKTAKDGVNIFYKVEVSSVAIVPNANHVFQIYVTAADGTVFYVDKCFWRWGTFAAIQTEWTDHPLIYNHYDARWLPNKPGGAGAGHAGHINYFDVDDLQGDVDARLLMRVEFEQTADRTFGRHLIVGRRTRPNVCLFRWWLEAEDRFNHTFWGSAALARCSGGSRVTDNANAAGNVWWTLGVGVAPNLADQFGRFDVFGAVYTNDAVNTRFRLGYGYPEYWYQDSWKWPTFAGKWELLRLGSIDIDPFIRAGINPYYMNVRVEYAKDPGGDVAELDFIWLVPRDEPEMRLNGMPTTGADGLIPTTYDIVMGMDEDFEYRAIEEQATATHREPLILIGTPMTLQPREENRLYYVLLTWHDPDDIYEAHGAATDLQMIVNISYMPQYISPLE